MKNWAALYGPIRATIPIMNEIYTLVKKCEVVLTFPIIKKPRSKNIMTPNIKQPKPSKMRPIPIP